MSDDIEKALVAFTLIFASFFFALGVLVGWLIWG